MHASRACRRLAGRFSPKGPDSTSVAEVMRVLPCDAFWLHPIAPNRRRRRLFGRVGLWIYSHRLLETSRCDGRLACSRWTGTEPPREISAKKWRTAQLSEEKNDAEAIGKFLKASSGQKSKRSRRHTLDRFADSGRSLIEQAARAMACRPASSSARRPRLPEDRLGSSTARCGGHLALTKTHTVLYPSPRSSARIARCRTPGRCGSTRQRSSKYHEEDHERRTGVSDCERKRARPAH